MKIPPQMTEAGLTLAEDVLLRLCYGLQCAIYSGGIAHQPVCAGCKCGAA